MLKIYKTRFKGNQVEALKDIHFTVDKGDWCCESWVSPRQENQPCSTFLLVLDKNQQQGVSI